MNNKDSDKALQQVSLIIDDVSIEGKVERSEEEIVRLARKEVNERISYWKRKCSDFPKEKILALVALEFAAENLKNKKRNDTEPYTNAIRKLNNLLEDYLKPKI